MGCKDTLRPAPVGPITKSLIAMVTGLRGWLGTSTVDRLDPGNVQRIARNGVPGNFLARFGQRNDYLAPHHQYHFRLLHLIRRPVGQKYPERPKWMLKYAFLDGFRRHDHSLCMATPLHITSIPTSIPAEQWCDKKKIGPARNCSRPGRGLFLIWRDDLNQILADRSRRAFSCEKARPTDVGKSSSGRRTGSIISH